MLFSLLQSDVGMIEFVGLIKVNIVKGTDLAVRDVMSSDPYVMINLGHQVSTIFFGINGSLILQRCLFSFSVLLRLPANTFIFFSP